MLLKTLSLFSFIQVYRIPFLHQDLFHRDEQAPEAPVLKWRCPGRETEHKPTHKYMAKGQILLSTVGGTQARQRMVW
jgi:hypothetical protein